MDMALIMKVKGVARSCTGSKRDGGRLSSRCSDLDGRVTVEQDLCGEGARDSQSRG